jgi:acyl-CoA synthetase (AMP-forming)/AMP-acid ligase II
MAEFVLENIKSTGHQDLGSHIRAIVAEAPSRRAVTHLLRGEDEGTVLTYAELDRAARSLGAFFQARAAQTERAIMLFDGGVEPTVAFLGCLYGRVVAVPLPSPLSGRVDRYLPRVEKVVKDADVKFVLTTSGILKQLQDLAAKIPAFNELEWIALDSLPDMADGWVEEPIVETDLAYLQYTSGSTSDPKGVMISHGNLLSICAYDSELLDYSTKGTSTVCWMPYFHDYGLIEGLLIPLYNGLSIYTMAPLDFVQDPVRWLNAIHRYRASHSSGPNFAYELCVKKTTLEQREALDLTCWHKASIAAEPINSGTVERFVNTFASRGFRPETISPAWGLAEATLVVTATASSTSHVLNAAALEKNRIVYSTGDGPARTMVGCGKVLRGPWNVDVQIVDPETFEPSAPGMVGEVWVTGDLVAQGYWNRPAETAATFQAQVKDGNGSYYMRTGDLGFMAGDELVFTGRRKDLIIVEGRNHYPQDIEKTVEGSHPAFRRGCSIAFSLEEEGQVQVIVVAEINKEYRIVDAPAQDGDPRTTVLRKEIERTVLREVAEEHQIRVHQVVPIPTGTIPKTTSGKLQRSGCKQRFLAGTLPQCN